MTQEGFFSLVMDNPGCVSLGMSCVIQNPDTLALDG